MGGLAKPSGRIDASINPSGKSGKRGGRTDVQKLGFRKELWTVKEIDSWLREHGYGALK